LNAIVDKLLDVDKEARQTIDGAQQYYDKTLEDIQADKQRVRRQYYDKAKGHIDQLKIANDAQAEEEIAVIEARYKALGNALEEACRHSGEQWRQELFARCTGR